MYRASSFNQFFLIGWALDEGGWCFLSPLFLCILLLGILPYTSCMLRDAFWGPSLLIQFNLDFIYQKKKSSFNCKTCRYGCLVCIVVQLGCFHFGSWF